MLTTSLTYESHGTGTPVVLLHGLTFDRTSWRPIVERLGGDVHTIAIDLPAHGESSGPPCRLDEVADQVHALVEQLGIDRPIVVGHSMSGGVAMLYAAAYSARGAVVVDNPFDIRPFARFAKQLEPALRGPAFEQAFAPFQQSMRLDLVREPLPQVLRQDVVVGYWEQLLRSDPEELQAWIDQVARTIAVPCLALFGQTLADADRDRIAAQVPAATVEEWDGAGHCLHLVEPDRFAARLRRFIEDCRAAE
jgi:pimeloyl-ACP methyl ester carboxylesterase